MNVGNKILSSFGTTIFEVMSRLSQKHGAVNLGQGFPDGNGPVDVVEAAVEYLRNGVNQYPSMFGLPELRTAVAEHASRFYGLEIDWQTETLVTSGGTEALCATLLGLIEPGDEVILIEPLYDSYLPIVKRAGGIPKLVSLRPPDWALPRAELEAAFSNATKLILVNTPMNPCAKVFSDDELNFIAALCQKYDVFAVCDEVYEHLAFDGLSHVPMITLPGMRTRTVRIQSAGKIFSLTGWKIGMITAAPDLLNPISKAHQYLTFTTPPNLQSAVAYGLRKDDVYFEELNSDMQARRDHLAKGLQEIGFEVVPCQGTYFLTTDFRPLGYNEMDTEFCEYLTVEAGVAAVPVSAFYTSENTSYFARFSFCKKPETIDEALRRLKNHFA
ncbi:MAG: putative N-succinyldiaminopimelate aminotransferase DapC [Alphaproteobacteria bacterium MarineAlpha11_Bin1]|nr:MAG: putative N-succinyldiaminopimelate aminotransferase DapC [Alphaproteobacteria bacterium MarineAlpha11_Bin1]